MQRHYLSVLAGLFAGLVFGLGLTVAQMLNPEKIIGFLDLAGDWDPSMAFVMGAAMAVATAGVAIGRKRRHPLVATQFAHPTSRVVDWRLLAGAALFGIGWGLIGFCPGPALAALPYAIDSTAIFVVAMFAGMFLFNIVQAHWLHRK